MRQMLSSTRGGLLRYAAGLALAGTLAACGGPTGPGSGHLLPNYFLSTVDGKPLPASTGNIPEGWTLTAALLVFPDSVRDRPRGWTPIQGLMTYTEFVRDDQQVEYQWVSQLNFTLTGNELRIDLCPPLALCLIRTELVGQVTDTDLVLTHYLGDEPRNVYRYFPALAD